MRKIIFLMLVLSCGQNPYVQLEDIDGEAVALDQDQGQNLTFLEPQGDLIPFIFFDEQNVHLIKGTVKVLESGEMEVEVEGNETPARIQAIVPNLEISNHDYENLNLGPIQPEGRESVIRGIYLLKN